MIRVLVTAFFLSQPVCALAEALPALYDVFGIESDDMLNVRSGPSTDFDIIGKLEPDVTGIELIDTDEPGDWGLINFEDRSGWVSLQYMRRASGQQVDGLPSNLICTGTEPFWSFSLDQGNSAEFERTDSKTIFENILSTAHPFMSVSCRF